MIKFEEIKNIKNEIKKIEILYLFESDFDETAEENVKKFFVNKGYYIERPLELRYCFYGNPLYKIKEIIKNNLKEKFDGFMKNIGIKGTPDFIVFKDEEFFFVEVKRDLDDTIQLSQIEFLDYLNKLNIQNFLVIAYSIGRGLKGE